MGDVEKKKLSCPICYNESVFYEDQVYGEVICVVCGTVLEDKKRVVP